MPYAGELSAFITAVMWTGSALTFAAATVRVGSVYVNVVRLAAAVVFLFLTILIFALPVHVSFTQVIFLSLSGFVGFVFGDTFLFKSYEYNDARIGSLMMSAAPAMAALMAFVFLHETLSFTGIAGMAITLAGIALVVSERKERSTHHVPISMVGVSYALLGALGQAGGMILAKGAFAEGEINGFVATFIRAFSATLVLAPMNYFAGRFTEPKKIFMNDTRALQFTLLGAVLGPYIGVTFSLIAISLTNVAIAATIISIVPILMLPAVWILRHLSAKWQ
jgi:drug/metabolite transporter (DMT)-like permease